MNNVYRPEDELNFENILKNPLRLFGVIYPYFALLLIVGGMYWVYNLDWAYKNNLKPQILQRDTVAEPLAMKKGSIMQGVDVKLVSQSTPEMVAKGLELYKANCSSCHGDDGKGMGIAAKGLNPAPRDFTSNDAWKNGKKLTDIWKTLEEGISGSGMVAYNYLPVQDRFAIVHYIHSLMSDVPKNTDDELAQLDVAYKLSEGKITANQIPVENAFKAVENDFKNISGKAGEFEKYLVFYKNEPGAKLILEHSSNNSKLITSLLRSDEWKNSQSAFVQEIASNINSNGFNVSVLRLNKNEIQLMYDFILKTLSQI